VAAPFLSAAWIDEARALYDTYADQLPKVSTAVVLNLLVNEVPFGDAELTAHVDTRSGGLVLDHGHVEGADLFVVVDYATAKAILVEGNPGAAMQAFLANKIRVEGDVAKLMVLAQQPMGDDAARYAAEIRAITE
jgi:hypothetical protein